MSGRRRLPARVRPLGAASIMSSFHTSDDDAVLQIRELWLSVQREMADGRGPFWEDWFECSKHEFKTKVDEHLAGMQITGENWYWLMHRAIAEYADYWDETGNADILRLYQED